MIRILQWWLVGMTLPFVVRTLLVYGWGIDVPDIIRLWKEILIMALGVSGLVFAFQSHISLFDRGWMRYLLGLLVLLIVWSMVLAFGVHSQSLEEWAVFVKYDVFPRVVLLVGFVVTSICGGYSRLGRTMYTIISVLLIVGLIRWGVSAWSPQWLEWMGYSLDSYQWGVDAAPPARYLTQVWRGYIRNGSIFGGPTSWGFFLVAFAPWYLWRTRKSIMRDGSWRRCVWMLLLVLNVGLTFSRAAWGAFVVEIVALVALLCYLWYRHWGGNISRSTGAMQLGENITIQAIVRAVGVVCVGVIATIGLVRLTGPVDVPQAADRDQGVFQRDLSDKGHIDLFLEGISKVKSSPWVGYGVASVGPGAYRVTDDITIYHPENQYIQILMEVGLPGFLVWLALWGVLCYAVWLRRDMEGYMLLGGVMGLAIVGLVLHSMVESMSIYPWMLMMGAWLGSKKS